MKIKFKNKIYKNIKITSEHISFGKYYTAKGDTRPMSPLAIKTSMPCGKDTPIECYRYNFTILDFKALVDLGIIEIEVEKKKHSATGHYAFASWGAGVSGEGRGYSSGLGRGFSGAGNFILKN